MSEAIFRAFPLDPMTAVALPQFIGGLGSALRLKDMEKAALSQVDPRMWAGWSISIFGGDERVLAPRMDFVEGAVPAAARALLGREIEGAPDREVRFDYRQGILAEKISDLFGKQNADARSRLQRVSELAGKFTFTLLGTLPLTSEMYRAHMPIDPQTTIVPDQAGRVQVVFNGRARQKVLLEPGTPLDSVVAYGPGLTAAILAFKLAGRTNNMTFVSGGMGADFVNTYADLQLRAIRKGMALSPAGGSTESPKRSGDLPQARYFNSGMAAAAAALASGARVRNEHADVVIMSSVHSAGPEECLAGVEVAAQILAVGGLFIVRAPRDSLPGEAGLDIVAPRANDLFGSPITAGYVGHQTQYVDPSLPVMRPADFAIFRKQ